MKVIAHQYSNSTLFDFIRALVLAHATDPAAEHGAFSNDRSIVINGFEFSILSCQRGKGLVRVFEPQTNITWAQECLNGDDILTRTDKDGNPAQWISVALRYRLGIPQEHYRVTPIQGVRSFPAVKGGAVCA